MSAIKKHLSLQILKKSNVWPNNCVVKRLCASSCASLGCCASPIVLVDDMVFSNLVRPSLRLVGSRIFGSLVRNWISRKSHKKAVNQSKSAFKSFKPDSCMLRVALLSACVAASLSQPTQRRNEAGTWNYDRCDVTKMLTPAVCDPEAEPSAAFPSKCAVAALLRLSLPAGATCTMARTSGPSSASSGSSRPSMFVAAKRIPLSRTISPPPSTTPRRNPTSSRPTDRLTSCLPRA